MSRRARSSLAVLPLVFLAGASWVSILSSHRQPGRYRIELAWAAPSAAHPFGCADGGLDIATYVSFAVGYVTLLAIVVATLSAVIGTFLGSGTAMAGAHAQRVLLRTCDLVQAFPNFLLALAVLSAVRKPERWHIALVLLLTSWAGF